MAVLSEAQPGTVGLAAGAKRSGNQDDCLFSALDTWEHKLGTGPTGWAL